MPLTSPPRFRERNLELVALEDATPTIGGVLADKKGRVLALWASFSRGSGKVPDAIFAGIPIERMIDLVDAFRAQKVLVWRTLGIELSPLTLAASRKLGLSEAQANLLEAHDPDGRRVLSVVRITAGSPAEGKLREGDLVTSALEDILDQLADDLLVLDDKDPRTLHGWRPPSLQVAFGAPTPISIPRPTVPSLAEFGGPPRAP